MRFTRTPVESAYVIDLDRRVDDRGSFARFWCVSEFAEQGLHVNFVQGNVAETTHRGTLRGMHYQVEPHAEAKLIRCTRGAIWDVVLDLRPDSPTFGVSHGVELSEENGRMLFIPEGCAHGYQSLTDGVEVFYLVSNAYTPAAERGVRYDDPAFGIAWPLEVTSISEKDVAWGATGDREQQVTGDR